MNNAEASRLCCNAIDRASESMPHIARAMRVDRSPSWAISDLKMALDNLEHASRLITGAIGELST